MSTRSRIDQLNRSRVSAVKIVFAALVNSISDEELKRNLDLRNAIKKIRHQFTLIDELNRSFEFER